jgi:hypothetical protein
VLRNCALFCLLTAFAVSCSSSSESATDAAGGDIYPPTNAESAYSCSVRQGFNFEKDAQAIVGFVNSVKIGTKELAADLDVTNPEDISAAPIKVVGVLSSIYWEGGYADPVQLSAQVKTDNKNDLVTLVHSTLSNTEVELELTVYDYDSKEKRYFKAFHCNETSLKGLVHKSGGELSISIDTDEGMKVASPKNFAFTLGVMPQDEAQKIHLAVSVSDKFEKDWGKEVAP